MATAIEYTPHAGQWRLHQSPARFRVACCGRRWGKTLGVMADMVDAACSIQGDYAWIGPTYNVTERGLDELRNLAPPGLCAIKGNGPRVAHFPNGSRLFFLSADNPDSILGYGFRGIAMDEAAVINVQTWQQIIRPTISQTMGWVIFISTPRGRNYFYDLFTMGLDPQEPDYEAFTFPSHENPYFPPEELEEARRTLPDTIFRQEYLAEFLEDSAGVFTGIDACLRPACTHNSGIVIGNDLAKHQDFTVLIAGCMECGSGREMLRFNKLDWPEQKRRIIDFAKKYDGRLVVDSTGVGDPIYDDLKLAGITVEGFKLTNQSKAQIIQGLMVDIEQGRISWPKEWDVVTNELRRYEYEYSSTGTLRYNAPAGYHDDCVIALALMAYGVRATLRPTVFTADSEADSEAVSIWDDDTAWI